MLKTDEIKKQIDVLPIEMLNEVEQFIKNLKFRKKTVAQKSTLLADLSECAIDIDLPEDFSKHHDHYLYGLPKK
jgi:hypothetical protein